MNQKFKTPLKLQRYICSPFIISGLLLLSISLPSVHAADSSNFAYVTDLSSNTVYVVDPASGIVTGTVSTIGFDSFADPSEVAISSDGTFSFITDTSNGDIYKIQTSSNQVESYVDKGAFTANLTQPFAIAISPDMNFGYVGDGVSKKVFKIDVPSNSVVSEVGTLTRNPAVIAVSPDNSFAYVTNKTDALYRIDVSANTLSSVGTGFGQAVIVAISGDGQFAYVTNESTSGGVFKVNTSDNSKSEVSGSFGGGYGVTISSDDQFAYVASYFDNLIYKIQTASNAVESTISITRPFILGITPDGKYLIVSDQGTNLYQVDLATNQVSSIVNNLGSSFTTTYWVGTVPSYSGGKISLNGLVGNNKILAKYLNAYAPAKIRGLFSLLKGPELAYALELANPLRNTASTFATQINQISLNRLVTNHLVNIRQTNQKMTFYRSSKGSSTSANPDTVQEDLIAANDDLALGLSFASRQKNSPNRDHKNLDNAKNPKINFWMGGFGDVFYDQPKHQTPDFKAVSGGFVTACDYKVNNQYSVGAGFAYAHTGITQDDDFGYSTVNQESLFTYGSFDIKDFYFDTSLWGGYYQLKNVRYISFKGYSDKAYSNPHGWQLTPHLEFGYNYWQGILNVNPFTMADSVNNWESSFKEHGASGLNMGGKGRFCSFLRSETGLRLQEVLSYGWGNVTFLEKVSYAYQKTFGTGSMTAFLIGSPGSFSVSTLTTAQNLGVGEVEVSFQPKNIKYPYGSLGFHVEAGSSYQSYQGLAELGWKF